MFLNFNYTFTDKSYNNPREFDQYNEDKYSSVKSIHIHGTTDRHDNNPVIFGFGDEIDDDYKSIEKLNDNSYLEHIKSINYLETDNYKKLLEYINSGNFQIFIFGHSCGISDRTLLNTIFEHENCASIKLFYHQKAEHIDNYSDIVRNISRNFNDKAKMRDRVVNKNYCEQLK
ncbi:AbiH family protein [Lacinutrix neustonica]|uniref:AbiH family protein n=1 Tax=Lacinutrix neustonica TaxID=2980107 RepID=A0A9E8SFI8_9FLAO|nr:AbiH family protein [Lacinutrix neustonica]WAC03842.1 AbiH family protein [Lacinutrix neustonica]